MTYGGEIKNIEQAEKIICSISLHFKFFISKSEKVWEIKKLLKV